MVILNAITPDWMPLVLFAFGHLRLELGNTSSTLQDGKDNLAVAGCKADHPLAQAIASSNWHWMQCYSPVGTGGLQDLFIQSTLPSLVQDTFLRRTAFLK